MSDSLIGRTLGKYQILEKLGQGGMGMVFKALQPSLNRTVAIKVLPAQLAMDPEFVQRFRQEAQVIASLQHESIVHVYDIDEAVLASGETLYFIVMELVEGQTLRQWAGRGRALPVAEVQRVGIELARALDYAHQRGIVHRDVKTANAMVTRDSRVKLMDFGIAKSAGGFRTMTGSVLGTPEYMSPEQARSGKVTAQSDIYSLGVVLYEMATGQLPFSGEDAFAVALQHLSKEPPRPRELNAGIPEWLEKIILKAIAKDPAERYASAALLAADLRAGGGAAAAAEPRPSLAHLTDPSAPTLAAGVTPPGWPSTPPPSAPQAGWPAPPSAASPTGAHLPTTPIRVPNAAQGFGAAPPGPSLPPTPPGSYPSPTGAQGAPSGVAGVAGVAWGAAGAYVPPTPPPAPGGWGAPPPSQAMPPAPPALPPPQQPSAPGWPPTPYPPSGQAPPGTYAGPPPATQYPTGGPRSSLLFNRGGRLKLIAIGGLVILAGVGAIAGAFLGRPGRVELGKGGGEVLQPGRGGAGGVGASGGEEPPPPPPDPQEAPETPIQPTRRPPAQPQRPESPQGSYPSPGGAPPAEYPQGGDTEPQESGPTAGELWSQAYRLKEQKQFHSLREVLGRLMAKDPNYGEAREWRGEIDEWVADREKELRNQTEDLIDEVVDALADRDEENLAEQWGGNLDPASRVFAAELWKLGPRLKWTAKLRSFKAWDDKANFTVVLIIADRNNRTLREVTWNGSMIDDDQGTRLVAPLR